MRVKLAEIESSSELFSRYLISIKRTIGRSEVLEGVRTNLQKFFQNRAFPSDFLEFLNQHEVIIFIDFNEEERYRIGRDITNPEEVSLFLGEVYSNIKNSSPVFLPIFEALIIRIFPTIFSTARESEGFGRRIKKVFDDLSSSIPENERKFLDHLHKGPYLLGINLRSLSLGDLEQFYHRYGFTTDAFKEMHETLMESFRAREEEHLLKLLESSEITDYADLRNFPFKDFLYPSEKALNRFAKMVSSKAASKEKILKQQDRELDMLSRKVREETQKILEKTMKELQNILDINARGDLSKAIEGSQIAIIDLLKRIKFHMRIFKDYLEKMEEMGKRIEENRGLQSMNPEKLMEFLPPHPEWEIEKVVREYWRAEKYFDVIEPKVLKIVQKNLTREAKRDPDIFEPLLDESRKGIYVDPDMAVGNYHLIMRSILEPIYIYKILGDIVYIWPPKVDPRNPKSYVDATDAIHLTGIELLPNGKFYRFSRKGKVAPSVNVSLLERQKEIGGILTRNFASLVTVLVYDVRGSTFMSHKLHDAEKQRSILNKFHYVVFDTARKGGGFLLKETGDGGIIWYGGNSQELFREIYKTFWSEKEYRIRFSTAVEEEFNLLKDPSSGLKAVGSAVRIVNAAEEFVKTNYMHYREWFGELAEKEVLHEGITYALLPPEFKTLFRLGIGIASGRPGKDVVFTPNSFGDPDLTGLLVNEATVFSTGRSPERSVILIDHPTLMNIILNSERFSLTGKYGERLEDEEVIDKLLSILRMRGGEKTYFMEGYRIKRAGIYFMDEEDKSKQLFLEIAEIEFDIKEDGDFVSDRGRIKLIYQVIPEEE